MAQEAWARVSARRAQRQPDSPHIMDMPPSVELLAQLRPPQRLLAMVLFVARQIEQAREEDLADRAEWWFQLMMAMVWSYEQNPNNF